MAETPETSDHTSIKLRIEYWKNKSHQSRSDHNDNLQPKSLLPFAGNLRQPMPRGLSFNLIDYIELVDWTGRIIRDDKRGAINKTAPPILQRSIFQLDTGSNCPLRLNNASKGLRVLLNPLKHYVLTSVLPGSSIVAAASYCTANRLKPTYI